MRAISRIVTTVVLFGFPAVLASGCATGSGASLTPVSSASLSRAATASPVANWEAAKNTASWLQFGYDAGHSGDNPVETIIGPKNVSQLKIAWNDDTIVQPGGIVVDGSVAYVDDMGQSNEGLYAFNAATGAQKWYADLKLNGSWGNFTHAVAAVAGNVIISPCSNGSSSKFLTGLCGVNAKNGKVLWKTYCTEYQSSPCGGLADGGSSPTLYGNRIYFQSVQGINEQPDTQALDPKTGKILWDVAGEYHCPDAGDQTGNPLPAADGLVFAVLGCQAQSGATEICALSAASGKAAWCDLSPPYIENFIASNGKLYVTEPGSSNVVVLALDDKTGAKSWMVNLPSSNYSMIAAANNAVFVEDGARGVYALSAGSGKSLWSYTANGNLIGAGVISVANGIVYTDGGGGNNGNVAIAAFNEKNGSIIWTSGTIGNGSAPATPVIVNGRIYTGCYTLCAFNLPSKESPR